MTSYKKAAIFYSLAIGLTMLLWILGKFNNPVFLSGYIIYGLYVFLLTFSKTSPFPVMFPLTHFTYKDLIKLVEFIVALYAFSYITLTIVSFLVTENFALKDIFGFGYFLINTFIVVIVTLLYLSTRMIVQTFTHKLS